MRIKCYLYPLLILLILSGCVPADNDVKPLRIAVAANFQWPMRVLIDEYKKDNPQATISLSSASSGVLYAQIQRGAPFDLFFSADRDRPLKLSDELDLDKVYTYAYGRLVLWAPRAHDISLNNLASLTGKIAVAKPELAPYGAATQEVLTHSDFWQEIKPKLVWGNNVTQVEQFLKSGAVEAGFLSLAQVRASNIDEEKVWVVPRNLYEPIEQKVIVLRQGDNVALGESFLNFVLSKSGQNVIHALGYGTSEG